MVDRDQTAALRVARQREPRSERGSRCSSIAPRRGNISHGQIKTRKKSLLRIIPDEKIPSGPYAIASATDGFLASGLKNFKFGNLELDRKQTVVLVDDQSALNPGRFAFAFFVFRQ